MGRAAEDVAAVGSVTTDGRHTGRGGRPERTALSSLIVICRLRLRLRLGVERSRVQAADTGDVVEVGIGRDYRVQAILPHHRDMDEVARLDSTRTVFLEQLGRSIPSIG